MKTFQSMGLLKTLNENLHKMQFTIPTPIQEKAIPLALEGKDILGSAQTGTGKTLAFGIPLVTHLINNPSKVALIVTPTRELAKQVLVEINRILNGNTDIRSVLLIGGMPMPKQLQSLRKNPQLIVGTPGRINDHLQRGSLNLCKANFLVLDETDRMLDMGFVEQIENILKYMSPQRQTLLFSATMPKNIIRIAEKYLNNPSHIAVDKASSPATNIEQSTIAISEKEKYPNLLSEIDARKGSIIVFVKTKFSSEKMAAKLTKQGYLANAIHGDLRQNKRDRVLANFRKQKYRILVATDVAARGLDIPHIEHVINYDLPQCAEDYIHRIGRTARAGAKGSALNFVSPNDKNKWNAINRLLKPESKGSFKVSDKKKRKTRSRFKKSNKKRYFNR